METKKGGIEQYCYNEILERFPKELVSVTATTLAASKTTITTCRAECLHFVGAKVPESLFHFQLTANRHGNPMQSST